MLVNLKDNDTIVRHHLKESKTGFIAVSDKDGFDKYMTERQRMEKTQKEIQAIHDELRDLKELILNAFKAK